MKGPDLPILAVAILLVGIIAWLIESNRQPQGGTVIPAEQFDLTITPGTADRTLTIERDEEPHLYRFENFPAETEVCYRDACIQLGAIR